MKQALSAALSLLLAASASAQAPASAMMKIGTAAAVRGAVMAASAGAVGRVVSSGKPLFLNDHVTTDAAGRLQILLVDETVFTLGPNSDMVLDDFVYDPKTGAGKISADIAKGTFRFVTGKIAQHDPEKMKIKTAVGTIGVRGSIGVGETGPNGTTIINGGARNADNHDDAAGIYAESGGRVENLTQPGVGTRISAGGRIEKPRFMTAELNGIMGGLQAPVAPGGGAGSGGTHAGASSGGQSATDASGRSTSVGGAFAATSVSALTLSAEANTAASLAVQTAANGVADGISTWDQIRSVTTGSGSYSATGSATCSGGVCSSTMNGTWTINATVNFAQQTIGGSMNLSIPGASFTDTASINSTSYATFSGQSSHVFQAADLSNPAFAHGTSVGLLNQGGTVAKNLTGTLQYVNGPTVINGATVTASR